MMKKKTLVSILSLLTLLTGCTKINKDKITTSSSTSSSTEPVSPVTPEEKKVSTVDSFEYNLNNVHKKYISIDSLKEQDVTDVIIPDEVDSLPIKFFSISGPKVKSLYIGKNVTANNLDGSKVKNTPNLVKIEVDKDNPNIYSQNNCVFRKSDNALLLGCKESVIPTDKSSIILNSQCFAYTNVERITIPSNVTDIYSSAFSGCRNLKEFYSQNSKYEVIDNALYNASSKTNKILLASTINTTKISTDENVTTLGNYAFYDMPIKSIYIPTNITTLDSYCFNNSDLEEVVFAPNTKIKNISTCFRNASKLKSIKIPSTVTSVEAEAFKNCSSLETIELPSTLSSIFLAMSSDNSPFYNCPMLKNIVIPSSVKNYTFDSSKRLIYTDNSGNKTLIGYFGNEENIVLEGFITICACAFNNNDNIKTIDISKLPNNSVCAYTFMYLNLDKVTISNLVASSSTSSNFFYRCNFKELNINCQLYNSMFYLCNVDKLTIGENVNVVNTSYFKELICSYIDVDANNTKYISKNGYLYSKDGKTLYKGINIEQSVVFEQTTTISNYSFYYCDKLTNIYIPESVTSIGIYCFNYATNLKEAKLPQNLTKLNSGLFYGTQISDFTISANVELLDYGCFCVQNKHIKELIIPESVTRIGQHIYQGMIDKLEIKNPTISIGHTYGTSYTPYLEYIYAKQIYFHGTLTQFKAIFGSLNEFTHNFTTSNSFDELYVLENGNFVKYTFDQVKDSF